VKSAATNASVARSSAFSKSGHGFGDIIIKSFATHSSKICRVAKTRVSDFMMACFENHPNCHVHYHSGGLPEGEDRLQIHRDFSILLREDVNAKKKSLYKRNYRNAPYDRDRSWPVHEIERIFATITFLRQLPGADKRFFLHDIVLQQLVASHLSKMIPSEIYRLYRHRYLAYMNVESCKSMNIIITGRQNGKTTIVSILLVLLLVHGQGISIEVFSTSLKQAQNVATQVRAFLKQLPSGYYANLLQDNASGIKIKTSRGKVNKLCCQSATTTSTRGVAPDVSIIDEFGFMDVKFWETVVLPLLVVDTRTLTCITTPGEPASAISSFIQDQISCENPAASMFNVLNYSMVCARCRESGIVERCRHRLYLMPPWKSFYNMHCVLDAMSPESFVMEVMGESMGENNACFLARHVEKCFACIFTDNVVPSDNNVYITIDPTNGGDSNMAIVSFIFAANHEVVVSNGAIRINSSSKKPNGVWFRAINSYCMFL